MISKIKSNCPHNNPFEFYDVTFDDTLSEILRLNKLNKTNGNITVKILQLIADDVVQVLTCCFNSSLADNSFPDELIEKVVFKGLFSIILPFFVLLNIFCCWIELVLCILYTLISETFAGRNFRGFRGF